MARTVPPGGGRRDVPGRIARPLVPRSRHHADAVVRARERRRVPRRLLRVRAPARGARGGHGEGGVAPGRRDRPHGGIHPPLRRGPALERGPPPPPHPPPPPPPPR